MAAPGQVRQAFEAQAEWCGRLGSTFTARLCAVLARTLDPKTAIGARLLGWEGDPVSDALALRLCGGLHALVRRGEAPALARLYPPAALPGEEALAATLGPVLAEQGPALDPWLDGAPQTNEVGRSAVLMGGLLAVAARFGLPLVLLELGASAGLNLQLDRYRHRLGGIEAGDPDSPLLLAPEWRGPAPPAAPVRILARSGVDLRPLDPVAGAERLLAYVWPDQKRRLAQLEAALRIAAADPQAIEAGDAGEWLEARLAEAPEAGVCRVVMHSVAFPYFPAETQARIVGRLERVGERASEAAALAWLRFEKEAEDAEFSLRLRTWPGEDRRLAWTQAHGAWVEWA